MKKEAWVIVANSSEARFFRHDKGKKQLIEIETLIHPESRLHPRDLKSDKPGRAFDSLGSGRHALGQAVPVKQHESIVFAQQISNYIEAARVKGTLEYLHIAASPALLGLIRQELSPSARQLIENELAKDITHLPLAEIYDQFSLP